MPTRRFIQNQNASATCENCDRRRFQGVSSVHFLKLIEDQGEIGFWSKDFASNTTTWSAGIYRMLSAEVGMSIDLLQMMHPDDRERHDMLEAGLLHGHPIDVDFRILRADGTVRWINHRAEAVFDERGTCMRAIGILRDVTERCERERLIDLNWTRNQKILSLVGAVEWGFDSTGSLLFRHAWSKLTGQGVAAATNWGWLNVLNAESRIAAKRHCQEAFERRSDFNLKALYVSQDGITSEIQMSAAPIVEHDGAINEWVGMARQLVPTAHDPFAPSAVPDRLTHRQVKAARSLLGWTHEELATKAHISVSSIRRVEEGDKAMRSKTYAAIAKALLTHGIEFGPNNAISTTITVHHRHA